MLDVNSINVVIDHVIVSLLRDCFEKLSAQLGVLKKNVMHESFSPDEWTQM